MDPFKIYKAVKEQYKSYIQTFQVFKNADIKAFVEDGINKRKCFGRSRLFKLANVSKQVYPLQS